MKNERNKRKDYAGRAGTSEVLLARIPSTKESMGRSADYTRISTRIEHGTIAGTSSIPDGYGMTLSSSTFRELPVCPVNTIGAGHPGEVFSCAAVSPIIQYLNGAS